MLIEQEDFAKATSSRSTKLIHGGFRYLKQGNIHLVRESLHERGLLLRNAPHLVHPLAFVVPAYQWWEKPYYGLGLKVYDAMSGRLSIGASTVLGRDATLALAPTLRAEGLRGGIRYFDGQFDDARLAICMVQTVHDRGGVALNYMRVETLLKDGRGRMAGALARDMETGRAFELRSRVVINATGIFTDTLRRMDAPDAARMMTVSQGIHIVLDRSFLPGDTAIMVPRTADGRILFAIPWQGRVVVGTTDTPVPEPSLDPRPLRQEIDFLLEHTGLYLQKKPGGPDILSIFAGLRPLAKAGGGNTAAIARDHVLEVSPSGLITITGGKWTTCRKMAEDTVDRAIKSGGLPTRPCQTEHMRLHGAPAGDIESISNDRPEDPWDLSVHGTDAQAIRSLASENPALQQRVHPRLAHRNAEVIWAVRHEMARTVEDVLSRRLRMLVLDARAAMDAAPGVAALVASELGRDTDWQQRQAASFQAFCKGHLAEGI